MATCVISATANVIPVSETTNRDDSERSLVQRAQSGDEQAFATLFQLHKKRVYSVCLLMTKDIAEAEDLTQEAFLQLFRKIGTFRGESAFSTWLHRMSVNIVLMRFRKKSVVETSLDTTTNRDEAFDTPQKEFGVPDLRLNGVVDRVTLQALIKELPPGYRAMFILHHVQGYKHSEIAEILECSEGNSKSQVRRARIRLRDLIQKTPEDNARHDRQSTASSPTLDPMKHSFDPANA